MATIDPAQITKAGELLRSVADDPVRFFRAILGIDPDPWQCEALEALARGENVSIRSGHGVGKTTLLAGIVLWFLTTRPNCRIPCTAPSQHQLSDLLWADISKWLRASPLKDLVNWTATRVGIRDSEESWYASARSCAKPDNLAGFHETFLLYVVDEAPGVPDSIFQVIDGASTTEHAQIIMAGNPTQRSGYFHDSHTKHRKLWHTIRVSSEDSVRVSDDYPAQMAAKWGKDSDIYRVRVLGEFPLAESNSFIRLDLVERAVAAWHDAQPDGVDELGIDVARYGDDETCFCIRKGGYSLPLESHRGWSLTQTTGRAVQLIREHRIKAVKVDDSGLGGGVTDGLIEANTGAAIVPMNFGGPGNEDYDDYGTRMWAKARDMLQKDELALPDDSDLIGQLTTRRYVITSKGKCRLESKADMKKRGLPSPDKADAFVLALAGDYSYSISAASSGKKRLMTGMP